MRHPNKHLSTLVTKNNNAKKSTQSLEKNIRGNAYYNCLHWMGLHLCKNL